MTDSLLFQILNELIDERLRQFNGSDFVKDFDSSNRSIGKVSDFVDHARDRTTSNTVHGSKTENQCWLWTIIALVDLRNGFCII